MANRNWYPDLNCKTLVVQPPMLLVTKKAEKAKRELARDDMLNLGKLFTLLSLSPVQEILNKGRERKLRILLDGRNPSGMEKMEKRAMVEIDRVNYASDSEWPAEPYTPSKPVRMNAETILQRYQFLFTNGKTVKDMIRFANQQLVKNHEDRMSLKELGSVYDRTQPIVIG